MNNLNLTPVQVAVGVGLLIALFGGGLLLAMQLTGGLTDAERPVQVKLIHPLVTPQPTPTPRPTAMPTPVPAGLELLWLGEWYNDSVTGLADASYQQTADAFTAEDFGGLAATVSATNAITLGPCVHVTGFPWMRVALAVPTSHPLPTAVTSGGLNIISAMILQTDDDDPTIPYVLNIGEEPHYILVTRARLDCRKFGGQIWTVR